MKWRVQWGSKCMIDTQTSSLPLSVWEIKFRGVISGGWHLLHLSCTHCLCMRMPALCRHSSVHLKCRAGILWPCLTHLQLHSHPLLHTPLRCTHMLAADKTVFSPSPSSPSNTLSNTDIHNYPASSVWVRTNQQVNCLCKPSHLWGPCPARNPTDSEHTRTVNK